MFDLVFDASMAFNALGFLFGAIVMLLVAAGLIGYWLYWRLKSIRVKARIVAVRSTGTRRSDAEWVKQYEGNAATDDDRDFEEVKQEFTQGFKKQPIRTIVAGFFIMLFALMPFGFFGIGAYMAYDFMALKATGQQTQASIIRYEESYDSESGTSYYPVVEFRDGNGHMRQLKDRIGSGSPSYSVGEKLGVYYDTKNPERFVIDDFWHYMVFALIFMAISSVFIVVMFGSLFAQLGDKEAKGKPSAERKKLKALKRQHYANQQYTPVYEFKTLGGEVLQVDGDGGSNWLVDKLPGKELMIMFMPHKPDKARKPGKILFIFGLVFLLPGLFLLNMSLSQLEFNFGTLLVVFGGIGYAAFKMKDKIKPREEWPSFEEIKKELKGKGFIKVETENKRGYIMTPAEIRERVRMLDLNAMFVVPFMSLLGVVLVIGGAVMFQDMRGFSGNAVMAQGEVVSINSRSDSEGGYTYYPVVRFKPLHSDPVRFEDNVGSNPASKRVGDKVLVMYDPAKPKTAIIDRGWFNWLPSIGVFFLGVLCFIYALKMFVGVAERSRNGRKKGH